MIKGSYIFYTRISRHLKRLFLISLLGFSSWVNGQKSITIYADTEGNDSLAKYIAILKGQLLKSRDIKIDLADEGSFNGNGVYIVSFSSGQRNTKPPAELISKGVEGFLIASTEKFVKIWGNSNMAVGHGIFTWLESLGYRYYFAHPDWYIVPSSLTIYKRFKLVSQPSLSHRRIFYGYGTGSQKADADFVFWQMANKIGGTLNAIFGHAYDDIMLRNAQSFKEHPEWFYPVPAKGTLPESPKFDMSNEGLVQFVIQDAMKRVETSLKNKTQAYKMISLGPSDGAGTCNSPECQKLGTPTDRVYYLVNRVARALREKYPQTLVGCLAYVDYIAPPSKKVEPNVYTAITTAFNNSKYSTEQLVNEWSKKGGRVGIYDYFSWYAWDFDIPGQSQASQPFKIAESIRKYQKLGISGFDGESSIGWVSKGLGYYTASKVMWDPKTDVTVIRNEFFTKCFGKISSQMKSMWDEWEGYGFTQVRESDLARWIDLVNKAEKAEPSSAVQKRLFHIKSYLHYLALYRHYKLSKAEEDLLNLLNYGFRMFDYGSVPGYPAIFELGNRSKIPGMEWGPEAKWRYNKTFLTENELNTLLKQDRQELKFSAPVRKFANGNRFTNIPSLNNYKNLFSDSASTDNAFWLVDEWVVQIKTKGMGNYIDFTGDMIGDKTNPKPIKLSFYPYTPDGDVSKITPVFSYNYTATKVKEKINLDKLNAGYYTVIIEDPVKVYRLKFSPVINYSLVIRSTRQLKTTSLNYAFIYVPEGVSKFNIIKSRIVKFITPTGRKVDLVNDKEEDIQVAVQKGEAGLWRIKLLADRLYIEGIPPYVGISPLQMLISVDK